MDDSREVRLVQIATTRDRIFALDQEGRLWLSMFGIAGWTRITAPKVGEKVGEKA